MMKSNTIIILLTCLIIVSCGQENESTSQQKEPMIDREVFGQTQDGQEVDLYTLRNAEGMEVKVITLGGIITSWTAPDRQGNYKDVVLGFNELEPYLGEHPYFGALIGRFGNRIAKGKMEIDGEAYELATNNDLNHLHGGPTGFHTRVWEVISTTTLNNGNIELKLKYISADMEEGYPGELTCLVTYTLTSDNSLHIDYEATTDKTTVVNLTQHTYFNLSGANNPILDHKLMIDAEQYLPVDETLIPTGEFASVEETPFDFTSPKTIGEEINDGHPQLAIGGGYDHCWVFEKVDTVRLVASAYHPESGRKLIVYTDEPGIQFYSGNFLDGTLPSKDNGVYNKRSGFCLETQHFPDSPNQDAFPSVILSPGETYTSHTRYRLTAE